MPQGYTVPLPQRLFDADGNPAAGWLIYTYEPGTTTELDTWSDGGLTSLNENPIEADGDGYYRCFVAAGTNIKLVVHDADDVPVFTFDNLEPMVDPTIPDPSVTAVPTGGILAWSTDTAPANFLLCDGTAVSRTTYAALNTLYAAATPSYPFGNGNGTTTFNVPDLRQRFPLGLATSGTGSTLGGSGGAIDHTHTGPSHTHSVVVTRDGWGAALNSPSTTGRLNTGDAAGTGHLISSYQPTADLTVTSAAGGTGNTGTANAPFLAVNYIVKT